MAGIFDTAKDMLGGAAGDIKLPDLGGLDLGAIADKAKAAGFDPDQLQGLLSRFTGEDGKIDFGGLLDAAKGLGLDVDKLKGLIGK
jgi:hypothetical protein